MPEPKPLRRLTDKRKHEQCSTWVSRLARDHGRLSAALGRVARAERLDYG